jgi:hypothetical protein
VDIKADAYVQVVAAEAHLSVQQEHQHIAVSYFVHSVTHNYQVQTVVLCVIIAQAATLVAAMVAMLTAAVVLPMWHLKVAYLHAHVKQKSIWQQLLESTEKKVRSWPTLQTLIQNTINGLAQVEWAQCMPQRIQVVGQQAVSGGRVVTQDISLADATIHLVATFICHTVLVHLLHFHVQMYATTESVADQALLD